MDQKKIIIVRGGGDIATGTIHRLWSAGFRVLVLETQYPSAIRRQVSLCEAVYKNEVTIENMTGKLIQTVEDAEAIWENHKVPVLIDIAGEIIKQVKPFAVVDAILNKKNLGTNRGMAPLTIGIGPGFTAGKDVDAVIETMRGHNLGRIIRNGSAMPDTGIPGNIGGYSKERVIHASAEGTLQCVSAIGDIVHMGEQIAIIETKEGKIPVLATISGIIRGLIGDGFYVVNGFKIADIDPRVEEINNCYTISDKSRCIAGSVLEIICASL